MHVFWVTEIESDLRMGDGNRTCTMVQANKNVHVLFVNLVSRCEKVHVFVGECTFLMDKSARF